MYTRRLKKRSGPKGVSGGGGHKTQAHPRFMILFRRKRRIRKSKPATMKTVLRRLSLG